MPAMSVYIGGLGEDTQKEDLEREFGRFGTITKVWVARNFPGFACIDFENDDDADEAIKEMNGATINGHEIRVDACDGGIKRGQGRGRGDSFPMPAMSVYIGGLGEDTQKEDLEREFGRFGSITKVWVARNLPGFACIDFENDDDADEAIKEMNGATINGHEIRVDACDGGIKRGQGRGRGDGFPMPAMSVYIGGLGEDTQKEDLEREFGRFGTITKVWVARNLPGFACIDFENDDDADEAIKEMNGATINGHEIRVDACDGGIKRGQGRGRGDVSLTDGQGSSGSRGGRDRSFDSGFRRGGGGGRGFSRRGPRYGDGSGGYDSGSGYRSRSPIRQRVQSPIRFDPLYGSGIDIDGIHYTYAYLSSCSRGSFRVTIVQV